MITIEVTLAASHNGSSVYHQTGNMPATPSRLQPRDLQESPSFSGKDSEQKSQIFEVISLENRNLYHQSRRWAMSGRLL
jgi:hypothetical protein